LAAASSGDSPPHPLRITIKTSLHGTSGKDSLRAALPLRRCCSAVMGLLKLAANQSESLRFRPQQGQNPYLSRADRGIFNIDIQRSADVQLEGD
jgi:hypothetical protein